ncbi:hypothetical protein H8N03_19840 [Ramlibacter sp. USB13]|uniref:Uncharacterized protein n=1 Tax=Ramlibacter cellulosilyticus TaxID=2764187 RepID=A0A923MUZ9_9BURK|nr:hypothetical protein [Ramlibacter cellulosilyticus]MBC5785208.1 hypothetical protein [Ramlibacter cellulosilyticus]
MRPSFTPQHPALPAGGREFSREGRDCEASWRLTALMLFPRLNATPGPWLVLLAATCAFVAVRALELAAH